MMFLFKASTLQLLSLSALLPASVLVDAHGYLKSPRSRNWVAQQDGVSQGGAGTEGIPEQDFCPHCLNSKLASNLCSKGNAATLYDHWKDINGVPMPWDSQGTYDEGGLMEVEAVLTTNHAGHMDMYICPDGDSSTQECLWSNPLTMVKDELYGGPTDADYPERAYFANDQSQFKFTYKLPEGVCGENILVQWRYITANSCFPPGYKGTAVGERLQELGWLRASGMSDCQYPYDPTGATGSGKPEQFWNCAEITIKCSNPTVSPAPTPPPQPTPQPQPTSSPTKAPVAAPEAGYCNYNGCNGVAEGGDWCNENESQCEGSCSGTWCIVGGPGPTPTPPSQAPGYCNYNGCNGVAEGGDWCNQSQSQCENSCSGTWCASPVPPTYSPTATPTYVTTESPTPIPTTQPTGCTEDPADMFFLRFKNGDPNLPIFKSCQWLADSANTERLCSTKTDSYDSYGPPGEVCKATCDTCPTPPTTSPTVTPTANPTQTPTASPTTCTEDPADMFFLRYKNGDPNSPVFKSCQWLADSANTERLCSNKTASHGSYGPPGEVCKATCGNCPTSSPTLAPTKAPTKSPTKTPTKAPSASPTEGGDRCCSQFFDVCKDNPWCQESEENCTICNGVFLYNLPKQCIPRFGMCTNDEDGCCYPSTCTLTNGNKQCMYTPPSGPTTPTAPSPPTKAPTVTVTSAPVSSPVSTPTVGGTATTTRYWDCSGGSCGCGYIPPGASDPAHCSSNALFSAPSGNQYGATYYGTAAISASLGGGNWLTGCGQCFKVTGTGNVGGMSGVPTTLVLKSANFCPAGNPACEVGPHFDIAAPGFDFTASSLSNNCRNLFGDDATPFFACENWPNTSCNCSLFTDPTLREGCENFLSLGWNNVQVSYEKVDCPMELERQNCWEENGGSWPTTEPQWCANN